MRQVVRDLLDRQPPVARLHDAVGLVAVRRLHEGPSGIAHLEELDRVGHALDHPVAVRHHLQRGLAEAFQSALRQQGLPTARQHHHACGDRLRQAFDFERLGAARDVGLGVLAQDDRAHVQAGACLQRHRQTCQGAVVRHRVGDRVGGRLEQQQHAVGLVDLATAPGVEQPARHPVVRGPHLGHRGVAQLLGQLGAVHHVGQEQRPDFTHRSARVSCRLVRADSG